MKIIKIDTIKILLIFLFLTGIGFALTNPTVTVTPDSTNQYAQYSIAATTANGTRIRANIDTFVVTFDSSTFVPSSIDQSYITINSVASPAVWVNGQVVKILSPIDKPNGPGLAFTINISESANIRNPLTSGTHTLVLNIVKQGHADDGPATSSPYSIYTSNTTITAAGVTPNPSLESQTAAYTMGFDVGAGGYLTAGSGTITIAFPSATTVPNGSLSGVSVNGTAATATASNDTVIITTPVNINNESTVSVSFSSGSGLVNPSTAQSYNLSIKTSSENTFISSEDYTIDAFGDFAVTGVVSITPNTVNAQAEYGISFVTSSTGALTANTDTIFAIFPQNTYIPSGLTTSNVTISSGGFSDNAYALAVLSNDATNDDTLAIITPINIGVETTASVTISSSGGMLNPSESGNYILSLKTSSDTTPDESNPYTINYTTTTVSQASVTPGSTTTSAVTSYSIDFNLGSLGRLAPDSSTITFTFASPYTLSSTLSHYDNSTITINSGTPISIPTTNFTVNNTAKTIEIKVPSAAVTGNSNNIVILLDGSTTDPITNPTTANSYIVNVKTSVENTNIGSNTYTIGGTSVTFNSLTLSDSTVNSVFTYTFDFDIATNLIQDYGYIKIIFPEGTALPSTIATTDIQVNGSDAHVVNVAQSTRTVTITVPDRLRSPQENPVTVFFDTGANIFSPAVPSASFYNAIISTSEDITPVNTRAYEIVGSNTAVSNVSASASPSVVNATNVAYTVNFTTTSTGKLQGGTPAGSSTITLDFDTGTNIPASITAAAVSVNDNSSQNVSVLTSGLGGIVEINVPNGVTIDTSESVSVVFSSAAGLVNGSVAGTYDVTVKTSSDTVYSSIAGTEGDYTITALQSLTINSASSNPTTQNASASYSIDFDLGSTGALGIGDSIRIVFPSNTGLPVSMSTSDVTVEGSNPTTAPTIEGDTITIQTPTAFSNLDNITVLINQTAGILNPTIVQSYTLEVITSAEAGPFTSPSYNITQTTSTVSAADVTVASPIPSSLSAYTIDFNVGTNGRLLDGTSTITITFNANTGVSAILADYDNSTIAVNEGTPVSIASDIAVSGQEVTITIPTGITISNNDQITVVLDDDAISYPITNPSTSGDYTLQVRSSVETTDIASSSYTISSTSAVTNITVSVSPNIVNAASTDTVNFTAQNPLTAGVGTVTITFPSNTFVPSSMATSNVRVATGSGTPTNFADASSVSVNTSTRAVTITVPNNVAADSTVRVAFLTGAGIENPSITGSYTLQVRTSTQPLNGTSTSYTLQPTTTTISGLSVSVDPVQISVMGEYTYSFTTGSRGRLVSGTSTISLLFPDDITFTSGTPAASRVTVNSVTAQTVTLNTGVAADTLIITVPASVTIGNNTGVTVVIDQSAGIQNASTTTALTYNASTSVESTWPIGYDFSLPVELTLFETVQKEESVILNWITESEIDNAYWIIERKEISKDEYEKVQSKTLSVNNTESEFESIAELDGQGNTSSRTEYSYSDEKVEYGKIYAYRLIDVSYTGMQTYHNIIIQEMTLPKHFELRQNYPNPFNPSTSIGFVLPKATKVTLVIYDIRGRKVAELLDKKEYESGSWKVVWNGQNLHGEKVASGVYIYKLVADNFVKTKKMVLIR